MKRLLSLLALISLFSACTSSVLTQPPIPVQPPPALNVRVSLTQDGNAVTPETAQLRLDDDNPAFDAVDITDQRPHFILPTGGTYGVGGHLIVTLGGETYTVDLLLAPDIDVALPTRVVPLEPKEVFWKTFQGNFGTMKLPGCGLHMDAVFDPFLLIMWKENRPCFDQMMQMHADRGDNRVAVDPRSGYHGHNDVDLWHDPAQFASFLTDVRSRVNKYGEHFKVLVFMGGDGHIGNMRDPGALDHWKADIDALAAITEPITDATVTCWECRHDNSWVGAFGYVEMGRYLAQRFPRAVHAQHLVVNSSSWSSWPCDPRNADCDASRVNANDLDDPNRGNEINAWWNCRREGWCDVFLFQFETGSGYLYPESYPLDENGFRGAFSRWYEIVVRLGDDPNSTALSRGNRHGWPQVPVIAFEFIYDTYWNRDGKATEAYAVEFCKQALAMGSWGCGSASYRPGR